MESLEQTRAPRIVKIRTGLITCQQKVPLLRKIPPRAVGIILLLIGINIGAWVAVLVVLRFHSGLTGTAVLAYTLGLRHALDADHISAIDLMTRRLVAAGQRPVTVGTFFSLGHSTIVIITSIVVAATASSLTKKFDSFSYIGGIVGSSISSAFLLILGVANAYIMYLLVRQLRLLVRKDPSQEQDAFKIDGAGCLFRVFKKAFRIVDRPWKMYPLGVLFGLGFDTSSEVALLGLSALQAARGTTLWLILLFPLLFTVGMCLLDTTDGALMLSLYTSVNIAKDPIAILYYNIVLTGLTVVVAVVIGTLQVLTLALSAMPKNVADERSMHGFWAGVSNAGDHYDIIGGAVCGTFVVVGIASVLLYKPWRQWMEKRHPNMNKRSYSVQNNGERGVLISRHDGSTPHGPQDVRLRGQSPSVKGGRASHVLLAGTELDETELEKSSGSRSQAAQVPEPQSLGGENSRVILKTL